MPATYYPAIIDRSASGFGVTFPDFPGCIANGESVSEACVQGEKALALHIEAMVKDKDAIPQPSDCEQVRADLGEDEVIAMIRADVPVKVERVLVSIDSNLLRAIDASASNRSAFIADAARAYLGGVVAAGIIGQGELATKGFEDLEKRYGLKPKRPRNDFGTHVVSVKA
ncbi:type II toxin-antitoxin system HicB family antitoxin [Sphingomonas sp. BK069]|uniref:type II toxin-antitoxin system HicB family antitoxin n=1 Tax=Sphingomonas sp. BK069 TaxID=2586979 RepID=UPI001608A4BB|nr:type II toxin-antitoxin system HicB family antitoxin [Sphingomonas sp. BK069]MBB3347303.1 putative RNase H-like HicB family nuclease [Sphingomonas sp. BK069]